MVSDRKEPLVFGFLSGFTEYNSMVKQAEAWTLYRCLIPSGRSCPLPDCILLCGLVGRRCWEYDLGLLLQLYFTNNKLFHV